MMLWSVLAVAFVLTPACISILVWKDVDLTVRTVAERTKLS